MQILGSILSAIGNLLGRAGRGYARFLKARGPMGKLITVIMTGVFACCGFLLVMTPFIDTDIDSSSNNGGGLTSSQANEDEVVEEIDTDTLVSQAEIVWPG